MASTDGRMQINNNAPGQGWSCSYKLALNKTGKRGSAADGQQGGAISSKESNTESLLFSENELKGFVNRVPDTQTRIMSSIKLMTQLCYAMKAIDVFEFEAKVEEFEFSREAGEGIACYFKHGTKGVHTTFFNANLRVRAMTITTAFLVKSLEDEGETARPIIGVMLKAMFLTKQILTALEKPCLAVSVVVREFGKLWPREAMAAREWGLEAMQELEWIHALETMERMLGKKTW